MDWCADAIVKETPSHRSQCGGFAVSQNSNAQSSHAQTRCRFLLFIVLTINDRSNGRISATGAMAKTMTPNVDASSVRRSRPWATTRLTGVAPVGEQRAFRDFVA
jgi:hypothetical protein